MNVNKVIIVGRLTADPQLRTTQSGQSVATVSLATNRTWTDKNGAKQEEVEFHNVVLWGRQAEVASQYLAKGSLAFVEGRLRTRSWTDKEGQTKKTTEVVCERLQLGPRSAGASGGGPRSSPPDARKSPIASPADVPVVDISSDEGGEDAPPF